MVFVAKRRALEADTMILDMLTSKVSGISSCKGTNAVMVSHHHYLYPNHLPQSPFPNTITLVGRASTYVFRVKQGTQSLSP